MNTNDIIRDFFGQLGPGGEKLGDTDPLLSSGLLDSIAIVKLLAFLESEFDIVFSDTEFDPVNFESIETISALVDSKVC